MLLLFALCSLLVLLYVVAMDPRVVIRGVTRFKEDTVLILAFHQLDPSCDFFLRSRPGFRIGEKRFYVRIRQWLELQVLLKLGNRFYRTRLQQFGPQFQEQSVRTVHIRTVDLAVDGKHISNDVSSGLGDVY